MPPLVVAFWALVAVAVVGLLFDFYALKVQTARRWAVATLVLKSLVPLAFVAWWIYYNAVPGVVIEGLADLGVLAGLMLLSVVLLLAAFGCELAAWAAIKRSEGVRS